MKKPTLCPDCGAFVRLTWTESCGACGADLVFVDSEIIKPATEGLSRSMLIFEWMSRPLHVIGGVVIAIVLGSLGTIAYALSTLNNIDAQGQFVDKGAIVRLQDVTPPVLLPEAADRPADDTALLP